MTNQPFTKKEKRLARLGYCFGKNEDRNGLNPRVKCLTGKLRSELFFDRDAYETHNA